MKNEWIRKYETPDSGRSKSRSGRKDFRRKVKAEEILKEARKQMEAQGALLMKKSEEDTKDYTQRIASSCEMQRKQALLQAKQEVIQEVLEKAYQQILHL